MARTLSVVLAALSLGLGAYFAARAATVQRVEPRSESAHVNGVDVHCLIAGKGEAVVLIHGYVQTSHMWLPLIDELARTHTVIAPDLRGVGGSSVTESGYDKVSMAGDVHALVEKLGFKKAIVVGHDIGLMVAFAYAASFPTEVTRLALVDAPIPGIGPEWDQMYGNPALWHFHFVNSPIALDLVAGRERLFFEHFWTSFAANPAAITEQERSLYARVYATPGSMRAGFEWFRAFPKDVEDNRAFIAAPHGKLKMPLLTVAGEKSMGGALGAQGNRIAESTRAMIVPGGGHWLMEEKSTETVRALAEFVRGASN
jgi:pimeloyl-ACP methyl ester carboxylesterase